MKENGLSLEILMCKNELCNLTKELTLSYCLNNHGITTCLYDFMISMCMIYFIHQGTSIKST